MTSRHRVITVGDAVLACLVGCIAACDTPYLELDAGVVLTGAAFAAPFFWRGHWSWRFVMATVVTAYFFRCVVLYLAGSDAVRIIAFRDTSMGLLAVVGAYLVRLLIRKCTGEDGSTAAQQLIPERDASGGGRSGGEVIWKEADGAATRREGEEGVWSPPQFTLKAMFVFTLASAGLLAVGVTGGPDVACGVLMLGMLGLLIGGCIRLIRR